MKLRANFLLLIVIIWVWATCLSAQFRTGSGTENDPYLISSQTELNNIRHFSDAYFLQTGDIHLENDWHPIELFSGFYDGNGYTIYNLNIKTSQDNTGLFSVLSEGQISSLRLEGGSVTGRDNVGALVGSNEGGTIYRCSANLTVSGNEDVGGLIGSNFGRVEESFTYSSTVTGKLNTGGLVGANYGGQLINSYSTNTVSGISSTGGLTGLNIIDGKINNSYAAGKVSGQTDTGGIAGRNLYATIDNSFWDIEASGQVVSAESEHEETINYHGLTTVKMMQEDSFHNWDFANAWSISEWYNDDPYPSYPYLEWQILGDDPVGFEHNRPINYDPQFGEDGRPFYVNQNRYFWVSFPWISRDDDNNLFAYPRQTFEDLIKPLEAKVDSVWHWNVMDNEGDPFLEFKRWNENQVIYQGNLANFCSIRGYKIRFDGNPAIVPPGTYRLPLYGTFVDPLTEIPVYEVDHPDHDENWVGVFLPLIELPDALGPYAEGYFETIQAPEGTMVWDDEQWNQALTVQYGEMVKLTLLDGMGPLMIQWHDLNREGRSCDPAEHTPKPVARYFPISYGPSFESLFIEDICFDEDIVEIGVYAGEECIGAAIFEGEYPLEVLAYTNSNHSNENLSLVLYVGDGEYIRYNDFPVRELGSREYARQSIRPLQSKFTFLKIDRTGGERSLAVADEIDEEDILPPAFGLSQNYPNPFSLRAGVRSQGQTSISLSLPQDMPVSLNVYNIKGQLVRTLMSGEVARGEHTVRWNGKDNNNNIVSSGIYFYRLETDIETITRKMLIVR